MLGERPQSGASVSNDCNVRFLIYILSLSHQRIYLYLFIFLFCICMIILYAHPSVSTNIQDALMAEIQQPRWRSRIIPAILPGCQHKLPFGLRGIMGITLGDDPRTVELVSVIICW